MLKRILAVLGLAMTLAGCVVYGPPSGASWNGGDGPGTPGIGAPG